MSEGKWSTAFAAALNWAEIVCHCLLAPFGPSRILFLFYFLYFCCTSFGPVSGFLAAWLWGGEGEGGVARSRGKAGQQLHLSAICRKSCPAICIITNAHVNETRFPPVRNLHCNAFPHSRFFGFPMHLRSPFSKDCPLGFSSFYPDLSALPPVAAERFLPTKCNFSFVPA